MDQKRAVAELRERIQKLDLEILERLDARARLSLEIHARAEVEPNVDVGEAEWLQRLEAAASRELPTDSLRTIFRQIRASARALALAASAAGSGCAGLAVLPVVRVVVDVPPPQPNTQTRPAAQATARNADLMSPTASGHRYPVCRCYTAAAGASTPLQRFAVVKSSRPHAFR